MKGGWRDHQILITLQNRLLERLQCLNLLILFRPYLRSSVHLPHVSIVAGPRGFTATVVMARSTVTISPSVRKSTVYQTLPMKTRPAKIEEGIFGAPEPQNTRNPATTCLGGRSWWLGRVTVLQRRDGSDSILSARSTGNLQPHEPFIHLL